MIEKQDINVDIIVANAIRMQTYSSSPASLSHYSFKKMAGKPIYYY